MKTIKLFTTAVLALCLVACQKEGPKGDQGEQGVAGPDAKTFNYTVDFSAGETFKSYSGIVNSFDSGDVIVTFIDDPNESNLPGYWVQTPFVSDDGINFYAEVTNSGMVFINTEVAGENTSPWISAHYFNVKSVLIKSTGLAKNPNLDLTNYQEVKEAFNL